MDSGETKKLCRLRAWIPSGEGAISGDISRVIVKFRDYGHMLLGRWKPFTVSTAATCYIINVLLTADEWPIAFNMIGDGYHQLSHQGPAYIYCRHIHTYTHTFNSPFTGTTRVSWYQKGKTNLDFTEAKTVSDSGISWAVCKSAPRFRQITMPAPHHSKIFTGRMPCLPFNQQCQSTEGKIYIHTFIFRRLH